MIGSCILCIIAHQDVRATNVYDLLKETKPSPDYTLEVPQQLRHVPLIVRSGGSPRDMQKLLEAALHVELEVSERDKSIKVMIPVDSWKEKHGSAQAALGNLIAESIQSRGSGAPTIANYEHLLREWELKLGPQSSLQEYSASHDAVLKFRSYLSGQLLLDVGKDWLANTPPDGKIQTSIFNRGELSRFRESLALIKEMQRLSLEFNKTAKEAIASAGTYERRQAQLNHVNHLIERIMPQTDEVQKMVVSSCWVERWLLGWVRGYDSAGTCLVSEHFSMPFPIYSEPVVNRLETPASGVKAEIGADYANLIRQEFNMGQFSITKEPVWQLLKTPMSLERISLYLDPIVNDQPFVGWLPDTFLLSSYKYTKNTSLDISRWRAASEMQPDGWSVSQSATGVSICPNDPQGQLERALAPDTLNELASNLHDQTQFELAYWVDAVKNQGTNWMANRQFRADYDLIGRSGHASSAFDFAWVQEFAKDPKVSAWLKEPTNQFPLHTNVQIANVLLRHHEHEGVPRWEHDPASTQSATSVTIREQDQRVELRNFNGFTYNYFRPVDPAEWLVKPTQESSLSLFNLQDYEVVHGGDRLVWGAKFYEKVFGPATSEQMVEYLSKKSESTIGNLVPTF